MRDSIWRLILTGLLLNLIIPISSPAFGQCAVDDYYWAASYGDWFTPENWQHEQYDPCLGCVIVPGVPGYSDSAWIYNGGTALINGNANAKSIIIEDSDLHLLGGSLTVSDELTLLSNGWFEQTSGSTTARWENIGQLGSATLRQTAGINYITEALCIGIQPGSNGTYIHSGGTVTSTSLYWYHGIILGIDAGSEGTYELSGNAELNANHIVLGEKGRGTFIQTGGTNRVNWLDIGYELGSYGRYELSGSAELFADHVVIGGGDGLSNWATGTFIHSSGIHTVDFIGLDDGGTYELRSGGELRIGGEVGIGTFFCHCRFPYPGYPIAEFVMKGGTVTALNENATMYVCCLQGTLLGPGTFDINVTYFNADCYSGSSAIEATFAPQSLTVGGSFNVVQLTPADFAGGTVQNLLESCVFDLSFDGSFSGEFTVGIPYDEAEVAALDANEMSLLILRETGPDTYERLENVEIDIFRPYVYAQTDSFGKFAVKAQKIYVLSVGVKVPGEQVGQDIQAKRVRDAFASLPGVAQAELLILSTDNSNNTTLLASSINNAANDLSSEDIFIMYVGAHGFFEGGFDEPNVLAQYDAKNRELRISSTEDEHFYLSDVNYRDNISDDVFSNLFMGAPWPTVNKLFIIDTCYAGGFWGDITGLDSGDLGRLTRVTLIPAAPEGDFAGTCYDPSSGLWLGKLGDAIVKTLKNLRYSYHTISLQDLINVLQHYGSSYNCGAGLILDYRQNWSIPVETGFDVQPQFTDDFSFQLPVRRSILKSDIDDDGGVNLSDFSILANNWLRDDCEWPERCKGTDIAPEIPDGIVNILDLAVLIEHWLEGTAP